ncbi:hypothetical protein Ancab_039413 [Ancistrocladus abbreviatus]
MGLDKLFLGGGSVGSRRYRLGAQYRGTSVSGRAEGAKVVTCAGCTAAAGRWAAERGANAANVATCFDFFSDSRIDDLRRVSITIELQIQIARKVC